MPKLTRANYQTWMAMARDYINALDDENAPDIWAHYVWVATAQDPDDPIDTRTWQESTNAPQRRLRVQHNKAYAYLRRHLSAEIFDTTLRLPLHVPKLLRHLREYWHGHTVNDRA